MNEGDPKDLAATLRAFLDALLLADHKDRLEAIHAVANAYCVFCAAKSNRPGECDNPECKFRSVSF